MYPDVGSLPKTPQNSSFHCNVIVATAMPSKKPRNTSPSSKRLLTTIRACSGSSKLCHWSLPLLSNQMAASRSMSKTADSSPSSARQIFNVNIPILTKNYGLADSSRCFPSGFPVVFHPAVRDTEHPLAPHFLL